MSSIIRKLIPTRTISPESYGISIEGYKQTNPITLRKDQIEAVNFILDNQYAMYSAGCGTGKTLVSLTAAEIDYQKTGRLQVILCPSETISNGFTHNPKNPKKVKWGRQIIQVGAMSRFNLLGGKIQQKAVKFERLLNEGEYSEANSIVVLSYQTAVTVFSKLGKRKLHKILDNCVIRLDEAHHADTRDNMNELGKQLHRILQYENSQVSFTTATAYRADGSIFSPEDLNKIAKKSLPLIEHLSINEIHCMEEEFGELDTEDPAQMALRAIRRARKDGFRFHLVQVPASRQQWRDQTEYGGFAEFYEEISALRHNGNGRQLKVLDTVTRSNQVYAKEIAANDFVDPEDGKPFDIVLTCKMVLEGVDWTRCDHIVATTMPTQSIVLAAQLRGRMWRKFTGKHKVRFTAALYSDATEESVLNDYVNTMLYILHVEDEVAPLNAIVKDQNGDKVRKSVRDHVYELTGDRQLFDSMLEELISIYELHRNDPDFVEQSACEIASNYLSEHSVEDQQLTAAALLRTLERKIVHPPGSNKRVKPIKTDVDISYIAEGGFSKIVQDHGSPSLLFRGDISLQDHERFLEIIRGERFANQSLFYYIEEHEELPVSGPRGQKQSTEYTALKKARHKVSCKKKRCVECVKWSWSEIDKLDRLCDANGIEWRKPDVHKLVQELWDYVKKNKQAPPKNKETAPISNALCKMIRGTHYQQYLKDTKKLFKKHGVKFETYRGNAMFPGRQSLIDYIEEHGELPVRGGSRTTEYVALLKAREGGWKAEHIKILDKVCKKHRITWRTR